jgi:shikimate dehydrogenase
MLGEFTGIDKYGVIGYPISHSRSPVIHRLFALQTGHRIQYDLYQVAPYELETSIKLHQASGTRGLNVTVPHKSKVATIVDRLSDRAAKAGAVNTLVFEDGEIYGDNTDGSGLVRDLVHNLQLQLKGGNILILGAGGATRGILHPLLALQPAQIMLANRTIEKAQALVDITYEGAPVAACQFDNIPTTEPWQLIINATSAGLQGQVPPYPTTAIDADTICYDLSYGLNATPFSRWAKEHGARKSVMGWGMLVEQAADSFEIWRGIRPNTAPVLKQLKFSAA